MFIFQCVFSFSRIGIRGDFTCAVRFSDLKRVDFGSEWVALPKRSQGRRVNVWVALAVVLLAVNIGQFAFFVWLRPSVPVEDSPIQVGDVTGVNRASFLGKTVTLEGYFVGVLGGKSFLTAGLDDFRQNRILPLTRFVTIGGDLPLDLLNQTGSRILLKGVVGIDDLNANLTRISYVSHKVVEPSAQNYALWNWDKQISIPTPPFLQPHKYAVLMSGGWDAEHAFMRYWNDLKFMFAILTGYGYSGSNIFVLYKDGVPEDAGIFVNASCTYANVAAAFSTLQAKMTDLDDLFIYTTNHGNPALCLWNHDVLIPSDLASMLQGITCHVMIILMQQCYGGAFVQDLSGSNRVIMTAANSSQYSWACDKEGPWDEFTYHFMDAMRGMTLIADPVFADYNSDGKVSMVEAFNYAQSMDSCAEIPQFDDNGDGVSHSGWMTVGGDGYPGGLGATTFL